MYKIDKQPYGLHLTFSGHISAGEMQLWLTDFSEQVDTIKSDFCVFVDMREIKMVPPESQPALRVGQEYARSHGMQRSVVILSDQVIRMQFRKIARQTGIFEWERYIDASDNPMWKQQGMGWILDSVDPDPENASGPLSTVGESCATKNVPT